MEALTKEQKEEIDRLYAMVKNDLPWKSREMSIDGEMVFIVYGDEYVMKCLILEAVTSAIRRKT